jgi:hypothetical protein
MAIFAAAFTVSQSSDCTTLTLTDTSNYNTIASPSANSNGYATSSFDVREFVISNSNYEAVTSLSMFNGDLNVTYALTSDQWLSVDLQLFLDTDPAPLTASYDVTHSVLSTCFLETCFAGLVAEAECGCGCGTGSCTCNNTQSDTVLLLQFIRAAQIFAQYSNPVLAQKQLDAGTAVCEANENNNN